MKMVYFGKEYEFVFKKGTYTNGRLAIQVMCRDVEEEYFEPFCRLTVNLPDIILSSDGSTDMPSNMAFLNTNNFEVDGIYKYLTDNGYMTITKTTAQSGFCTYPLVKFDETWLETLTQM